MKAKRFLKKLTLNKKTIANLENKEMNAIRGGITGTCPETYYIFCYTTSIPFCCW
jgi:natural product precursor